MDNIADRKEYHFESYALYANVDDSVFLLNPVIEKYGYTFIAIDLETFDKEFAYLFLPNIDNGSKQMAVFKHFQIRNDFFDALRDVHGIGIDILTNEKVYLLKRIETTEIVVTDGKYVTNNLTEILSKMHAFTISLTQQLRLLTKGGVYYPYLFQSAINKRSFIMRHSTLQNYPYGNLFHLLDEDVDKFKEMFSPNFDVSPLTQLAFSSFLLIYETRDERTKFVLLAICLECIFNNGADQISHTISRHLAIILSNTKEEFGLKYKEIKKLYGLRSKIVHGDHPKGPLTEPLERLENMVRFAINYCSKLKMNRMELFEYLNLKGFN